MKKAITLIRGGQHSTPSVPETSNSFIFNALRVVFLAFGLWLFATQAQAQYCTMACDNLVQVSLPGDCEAEILYDMILEGTYNGSTCSPNGPSAFVVTVMNQTGAPIPTSPFVNETHIGQYWQVKVKHWATGNSCWGNIFVEDKLPPQLTCPDDVTVACTESTDTSATGVPVVEDCSTFDIEYFDNSSGAGCAGSFAGIISRTWTATDFYNNSSSCTQTINVEQPSISDVIWPPNLDGISGPSIDCVAPVTHPDSTGYPTINGQPIPNGVGYCSMAVNYNDQTLPLCEGSYKILRNWTVVYWCTGEILNHVQIIAVKDTHAPTLTCPPALNVGTTSSQFCTATIILPEVGIADDCGSTFTVTMNTPAGWVSGNGGIINGVTPGGYTLTYNVSDACGNASSCSTPLTVADDDAPTVVCDEYTVVTLNNNGMALVFAETFDDGSYDNCGPVSFSVRRMTAACGTQPVFGPTVKFCCEDVGEDVTVEMQVTDYIGNANSCMVTVHVDDNSQPSILCPANVTLTCLDDPTDLGLTGEPTFSIPCGTVDADYTDSENLNLCNEGTITRTWTANGGNGSTSSCTQTITLVDNTPVTVVWPDDYTANGCVSIESLAPDSLPPPYNFPVVTEDCELIATNVSDQIFNVSAPACFKIVRTWTLMDWCDNQSVWTHQQTIMVYDNEAPTFTCPDNLTVSVDANCVGAVELPQVTDIQDCSQNTTVFVSSDLGSGFGPFLNVTPGTYSASYIVADGCNNSSSCSITIEVVDDKNPTPYCKNGLIIEMMGVDTDGDGVPDTGMVQTWASDFNDGSFDNCPGALKFSFSPNINDTGATFDCDDIGQQLIQMWVTDVAGNQDFCETFLIVQDNMGVCSGNFFASMGGAITNEMGEDVEDVEVSVNTGSNPMVMTGPDGNFEFPALPIGDDFTVSPAMDAGLLNGVSTYDIVLIKKHILGTESLGSPYKIIAADVNHSESVTTADLVAIQKAILQIEDSFPNNESWRFVDAAYEFPDPEDPFSEPFPEVYNINNFAGNMDNVNFTAVKIGDANNSAVPNLHTDPVDDRSGELLTLRTENEQVRPGQEVSVEFAAENFERIVGYQFTLDFDPAQLEFLHVETADLQTLNVSNFGFSFLEAGALTTSWNDFEPTTMPEDAVLFRLVFRGKTNTELAEAIGLGSDFTPAEAYFEDGEKLDVELFFSESRITNHESQVTIAPNPFSFSTTVGFWLENAQSVQLTVFDASGRTVISRQGAFAEGKGEFLLEASELNGAGTYFYRLEMEGGVATGRMVLLE